MTVTPLVIADLTQTTLEGTGVFDTLMRANKAHLDGEFQKGRIKGTEYATVYLGSLQTVMQSSLGFLLQNQKNTLEAQLLEAQIILAGVEVQKAQAELVIIQASVLKVPAEIALLQAQTAKLMKDASLADKQIELATQEILVKTQQVLVSQAEVGIAQAKLANIPKEGLHLDAQTAMITQQKANLTDELLTATLQRSKLTQENSNLAAQKLQVEAQTGMVGQQKTNLIAEALNIPLQGAMLFAQKCKLEAEFDLTVSTTLKSAQEITLLSQKVATEKAQTTSLGVDVDSVIGKQKALYSAQTTGFTRDAEQKAADLLVRSWSVQRTTDERGTKANAINMLNDATVGRVMTKLLAGVGA